MSKRDEEKIANVLAVVIVLGIITLIGLIGGSDKEKECIRYGCDRTVSGSSNYCFLHKSYTASSGTSGSYTGSSGSSGKSTTSESSTGKSSSGSYASSSIKKSSSQKSSYPSWSSYDEGYDSVYEDYNYDWDRYQSDSDYANGVEDAWSDLEDEGEWGW